MKDALHRILAWPIRLGGAVILTHFLLMLLSLLNSAHGATAPQRVFFSTARPGNWDIYELSGPGKPARRLTDEPGLDYDAAPSPDGRWLVFTSEQGGRNDETPLLLGQPQSYGKICAIRIADRKLVRLANNKWEDGTSSWVGPVE